MYKLKLYYEHPHNWRSINMGYCKIDFQDKKITFCFNKRDYDYYIYYNDINYYLQLNMFIILNIATDKKKDLIVSIYTENIKTFSEIFKKISDKCSKIKNIYNPIFIKT